MSTAQLIKVIQDNEYILPSVILNSLTLSQFVSELDDIYNHHRDKIEQDPEFRRKYTALVTFAVEQELHQKPKKSLLDPGLIQYLLSIPEPA